jgi:hypothetical protein
MNRDKQQLTLDWQGLALSVEFERDWLGDVGMSHIAVRSPDRQPLPITETGYRSMFVSTIILDEWGGPLPYVQAALDAEAKGPAWIAAQAKRRQLTLF